MTDRHLILICPILDTVPAVVLFSLAVIQAGKSLHDLFAHLLVPFLLALALTAVSAWRGFADTKRHLASRNTWLRPAAEGFLCGFLAVVIIHIIGIAQEAFAAGNPWPSVKYSPLSAWVPYLGRLLVEGSVWGAVGSAYGCFLSGLNRITIKALLANPSLQPTRNPRG
jgi:hypothetical protein